MASCTMLSVVTRIHDHAGNRPRVFLREWRVKLGLTQEQLAERIGTQKGTVSRHENHARGLKEHQILAYAEALGVDATRLFQHPDAPSLDELVRGVPDDLRLQIFRVVTALVRTGTEG